MRRLSGVDADMLYGETPEWHMHIGGLIVVDPADAPEPFGADELERLVHRFAVSLPAMRERLVTVPFGLDRPRWIEDEAFDPAAHVHRVTLAGPNDDAALAACINDAASTKLDRSRPLWEIWIIDGLEGGRLALYCKVHHACADGVGAALMLGHLLSLEPTPIPSERPPRPRGESPPSTTRLIGDAAADLVQLPLRAARAATSTFRAIQWIRDHVAPGANAAKPFSAPRTAFNYPVTARRSVAFTSVPLEDVRTIKRAFGTTVNDVVLAICGGALRSYLLHRCELPDEPLIAAVPVSVRDEVQMTTFGNMVSGWFANLATHVDDPVKRLHTIRDAAHDAKAIFESGIEDAVVEWADLAVPAAWNLGVRVYVRSRLSERVPPIFNLLISNVMGPAVELYAGEARLESLYPFGPVMDAIGCNITVMSIGDRVSFGITTCTDLVDDIWDLADAIPRAASDLLYATQRA